MSQSKKYREVYELYQLCSNGKDLKEQAVMERETWSHGGKTISGHVSDNSDIVSLHYDRRTDYRTLQLPVDCCQ